MAEAEFELGSNASAEAWGLWTCSSVAFCHMAFCQHWRYSWPEEGICVAVITVLCVLGKKQVEAFWEMDKNESLMKLFYLLPLILTERFIEANKGENVLTNKCVCDSGRGENINWGAAEHFWCGQQAGAAGCWAQEPSMGRMSHPLEISMPNAFILSSCVIIILPSKIVRPH